MDLKDLTKLLQQQQAGNDDTPGFKGVYKGERESPFPKLELPLSFRLMAFAMRHWKLALTLGILLFITLFGLGLWLFFALAGAMLDAILSLFSSPEIITPNPATPPLPPPSLSQGI